jgi:hypothetical protein
MIIRLFDKLGVEVHFIRLVYFTVFDIDLHERYHYPSIFADPALILDLVFLIGIILPLFGLSVRYYTWDVTQGPYKPKWNVLFAPLGIIVFFFYRDPDVLFMAILVSMANFWVAWRQMDGNDEDYSWMQYYRDEFTYR